MHSRPETVYLWLSHGANIYLKPLAATAGGERQGNQSLQLAQSPASDRMDREGVTGESASWEPESDSSSRPREADRSCAVAIAATAAAGAPNRLACTRFTFRHSPVK
mmetsp:Transcript_68950/g.158277  ORF Transcript_68950/g.158277 Transcript_68950/m.158277 type:complete len:107 (-) Transcript_68950:523-843(-)